MSKDTTMRNRPLPAANPKHRESLNTFVPGSAPIDRIYAPEELNVDGLAEAIRHLLTSSSAPRDSHLLSPRRGVTHVVEAKEATQWQ